MASFQWNETYATGNPQVDTQHKNLFAMVNDLHEAIVNARQQDVLLPTLEKLAKYTIEHFSHEEKLMLSKSYPGYTEHKKKHDDLAGQAKTIIAQYKSGELKLPITLSRFLNDWIAHHINEEDKKMIQWVKAH
jgi:hemerythrin